MRSRTGGAGVRTLPDLLLMLILLPLQILPGSVTPRKSMLEFVQFIMIGAPNTHFVMLARAVLYRGAGLSVVWPQFISLALMGTALFSLSLALPQNTRDDGMSAGTRGFFSRE